MNIRILAMSTSSLLAVALQASDGYAQTAETPHPSQPIIEEIIVTAQKRGEKINSIGMSITAASGLELRQKDVTSVQDLRRLEPSLQFSQSSYGTPIYTIRGVGYYEQSLAASPTVSIYQDEVAYPFPVMSKGALLDPERVEILKGPQGTLYGQNATGGAINFIAAKPTDALAAGVDATYARFNVARLETFLSGPLTSTLNARLAFSLEKGGAWQKSQTRDDTLGDKDMQAARLILDWRPSSRFKASLNLNGWLDRSDTVAPQLEGVFFIAPSVISPAALTPQIANHLPNAAYFATYPAAIQALVSQPTNSTSNRDADWAPGTHPRRDESYYQAALRMEYSLSDTVGLTSLTSYQRFKESNEVQPGGVGAVYTTNLVKGEVKTFSQELRLHSDAAGSRLNWIIGVNYEKVKSSEADITSPFLASPAYLTGGSLFSPLPLESFTFTPINNVKSETASIFANADYHLLDKLVFHAGARYTKSDQNIAACAQGSLPFATYINIAAAQLASAFGGPAPAPVSGGECITLGPPPNFQPGLQHNRLKEDNIPWRVGVDWTPFEHQLLYATISRGYKAGASPSLGATSYIQVIPVTQESIIAYELGAKLSLLDRSLQLNAAVFHYDYTNKQTLGTIPDPIFGGLQALVNIPKSAEDGAELSVVWRPAGGLTLNGTATYLDSRVTSHFLNYSSYILSPTDTIDFKGEPFPYTPKWSLLYGVRYDWQPTDSLSAFVSADASYQSRSTAAFGYGRAQVLGAPPQIIKPYSLLNLMAGISSQDGRWRAELWGKNVMNKYYWNTVATGGDLMARLTGMPATYGINLHFRY
jgi:outer membrane receptor protein involved in Fe transport